MSNWRRTVSALLGSPFVAVLIALALSGLLIAFSGANPLAAYQALILGAVGNKTAIAETLLKAAPLTLAGLGVMFAFRTNTFNIGAEGQIYFGALAATVLAISLPTLPAALLVPLLIAGAALAGGLWAAIPGYLKARFGTSEIILTIMLNYVAILVVGYLLEGPLQEPGGYQPISPLLPDAAQAPIILAGTRLHAATLLAPLAAFVAWVVLWRTPLGLRLRAVGDTPGAAKAAGISVPAMIILSMGISGALAGLAGMGEVTGVHHRLLAEFSPGYGTTSIAVALLGKLHPLGVLAAGLFFAGLRVGADTMQRWAGVPASAVYVIQGLVVICVIAGEFFRQKSVLLAALKGGSRRG